MNANIKSAASRRETAPIGSRRGGRLVLAEDPLEGPEARGLVVHRIAVHAGEEPGQMTEAVIPGELVHQREDVLVSGTRAGRLGGSEWCDDRGLPVGLRLYRIRGHRPHGRGGR